MLLQYEVQPSILLVMHLSNFGNEFGQEIKQRFLLFLDLGTDLKVPAYLIDPVELGQTWILLLAAFNFHIIDYH